MTKPKDEDTIFVKSHVARDLLGNAALFKTDKSVVWEYVSNGLQYVDEGTHPNVSVTLDSKKKKISIEDNGRGMDWRGLQNFFLMHGENIDRQQGRPGRGRFGTGKSAAFGIADILRVTTIRNKKLSQVELHRGDILSIKSEDPIPTKTIVKGKPVDSQNGTLTEIEGIHLKSLDHAGIIKYIERHLARWRNAKVYVNKRECEYSEPVISSIREFEPDVAQKKKMGNVKLIIKIASSFLDEEFRGVSIYSKGNWYETTLAGNEGREMSQYIFGEIDVPKIDEDESAIPPLDLSRSMKLNPSNELVQVIYSFIGNRIDLVRRELVQLDKQRKASEEAKRFAKQAEIIAKIINEDFYEFRDRVEKAKAKRGVGFDPQVPKINNGDKPDDFIFGSELPAVIDDLTGSLGSKGGTRVGGKEPMILNPLVSPSDSSDTDKLGQIAHAKETPAKSRGGFQVEFLPMGDKEYRAKYVRENRTILINIDHPQLAALKGSSSVDDPLFKKLAYEIAFSEYAIALSSELAARDQYIEISDPIIDIRETINRIARKAANLYST